MRLWCSKILNLSVANTNKVASIFNISFRTARSLWYQIKNIIESRSKVDIYSGKIGKCGRKEKD